MFLSVSQPAFVTKTTSPMISFDSIDTAAVSNVITQNANLIATSSDDFGGAFYPVAGIALLAVLILYLSPPLAD
jgi:hypothetical protein